MTDDRLRFQHFFRCRSCGTRFHVTRLTADPARVKTPACPRKKCGGKAKASYVDDIPMDVAAGKAPAQVGAIPVRALDLAMEVGAQNAGLTDLYDRPRYGETMAPKLPAHLQKQVDGFWGAPAREKRGRVNLSGVLGGQAPAAAIPQGARPTRVDNDSVIGMIHQGGEEHRPKITYLNP